MNVRLRLSGKETNVEAILGICTSNSVEATLVRTENVYLKDGTYELEPGVDLIMWGVSKETVVETIWPAMREAGAYRCAHVSTFHSNYEGCIYNWMQPTQCPATPRSLSQITVSDNSSGNRNL